MRSGLHAVPSAIAVPEATGSLTHRSDRLDQSGGMARIPGGSVPVLLSVDYWRVLTGGIQRSLVALCSRLRTPGPRDEIALWVRRFTAEG